ncbi:ribosome-associated ATPase/putative transporter RbbA [Methylococcus sp. EFPC2]|uniref:ribosome-associated ATPase/putative transporter RbbA n=1 Tax=Methylococcus sp. EFPC2 TaxID=2812648 RepID=UPI001966DF81|nr:ribosome-associated ATPase/putative transporter RbbA [Methylococcus sp. EFPC2]QSA95790.1 ribosome-associated ATPase/putative transporter RbbA [Methylococcus sp. EFPC2]
MTDTCAVAVSDVGHRYRRRPVLDGITLEFTRGELACFVGPDGVGKSTLLGLIAGVRRLQRGRIEILGTDLARTPGGTLAQRIAYMPQGLGQNLYPSLSVRENVEFFGRLFGLPSAIRARRIAILLAATGMEAFADRAAGQLSGGMKQKLGLCCALIHDPDLLILDEPTTGVDPLSRRQFWELIDRIRGQRPDMTVLAATAYMEEAERFDRIAAMNAGRVLACGTPAELKARTGAATMEEVFIALLPEQPRGGSRRPPPPRCYYDGEVAIEARGLAKSFNGFTAVQDVSFSIQKGEIFGFLGSNGCGKTTTMKMLTGLLPPSAGTALLFGKTLDAADQATRRRVGFMSQSFSLYGELSVAANLALHAHLFGLPPAGVRERVAELCREMDLSRHLDTRAEDLPLGIRQRLSLAVAWIHRPELLILDEPTSGVDPLARDRFWELLIGLSRRQGVTIFLSTHFMNEAARCDRISFMHAGRVLAQGTVEELTRGFGAHGLEAAFIDALERAQTPTRPRQTGEDATAFRPAGQAGVEASARFSPRRWWAFARREGLEVRRDTIRLSFALLGPLLLMVVMGYGISLDVEKLPYAALDYDRSPESRRYLDQFGASRYFRQEPELRDEPDRQSRLQAGQIALAVEIPAGFGRDIHAGREPEAGLFIDGAIPFRAETLKGYAEQIHAGYLDELARDGVVPEPAEAPYRLETRFWYNPDFKSRIALTPGVIGILLAVIPAILTAVGIVREKELGSIVNLYATPATKIEFLLGKQWPYLLLGLINASSMTALAVSLFGISIRGDPWALALGTSLYVAATSGFGLLVSCFTRTQIAALFAALLLTLLPAINFSGFLSPASSLVGGARVFGTLMPASYFLRIANGVYTKGLGLADLGSDFLALGGFYLVFLGLSWALLQSRQA